jgi:hypothetical protein
VTYRVDPEWGYTHIETPELLLEVAEKELSETVKQMHTRFGEICEILNIAINELGKKQNDKGGTND